MRFSKLVAVMLLVLWGAAGLRAADVSVPGSTTKYASDIEASVGGKTVKLTLTGVAMRTKLILNVYAIGSYVQQGAKVTSAAELASVDQPKRLHLVMERTVEGTAMAEAFRTAIRANYAEGTFNEEVTTLVQFMRSSVARQGDHITLTHVPGIGLHISIHGKADFTIKNPKFSKAVWDIYLGKANVGESVKKGLVNRL